MVFEEDLKQPIFTHTKKDFSFLIKSQCCSTYKIPISLRLAVPLTHISKTYDILCAPFHSSLKAKHSSYTHVDIESTYICGE